mgnify:CR=1 FL=1
MHCTKRYGPNCGNHLLRTSSAANVGADEDSAARRGEGLGPCPAGGLATDPVPTNVRCASRIGN